MYDSAIQKESRRNFTCLKLYPNNKYGKPRVCDLNNQKRNSQC